MTTWQLTTLERVGERELELLHVYRSLDLEQQKWLHVVARSYARTARARRPSNIIEFAPRNNGRR